MPSDLDFISLENEWEMSSEDDGDLGGSDVEVMSSAPDDEPNDAVDYWFGKRCLECVVAHHFLCTAGASDSSVDVDSKLEATLRQYPYEDKLNFLQAQGMVNPRFSISGDASDDYKTVLTLIGTIMRSGGRKERRTMLSSLHEFGGAAPQLRARAGGGTEAWARAEQTPFSGTTRSVHGAFSVAGLAKYTIALKEHGDLVGAQPSYTVAMESLDPPSFRAVVSFEGLKYDGTARTKKDARHLAAAKMCEGLGIMSS